MVDKDTASTSNGNEPNSSNEQRVTNATSPVPLAGVLRSSTDTRSFVIFAYDRVGDTQHMLDNLHSLEEATRQAGFTTLEVNLLTPEDETLDQQTGFFRENVSVLHQRILDVTNWLVDKADMQGISIGYFGVGVCGAAALAAAAARPDAVNAVIAVAPRTGLVESFLPGVVAPTLLIVAEKDMRALDMGHEALPALTSDMTLDIVRAARERGFANTLETIPDVANVFENEQSLQKVTELTTQWFTRHLETR